MFKALRKKTPEFHAAVGRAVMQQAWHNEVLGRAKFESDGNLIENDWSKGDADYRGRIAAADRSYSQQNDGGRSGRPDLLKWVDDVVLPKVIAVNERFAEKYQWGDPGARPSLSRREDATDSYLASRNKGLTTVTPQSVLDADIDLAVQAIDAVIDEIAGGNYQQMTVPVGPVPHVLRMLRAPTQMLKVDTGIIRKILIDKHSEDFANVSSREFVMGLYRPALVLNGDANGEYELVSNIITPKGPVMFVVKQDVSLPGNKTRVATVMSAYAKPISGNGSTIAKRVLNGKLAYADMLTAQSAITGQKMQTPSLDEAQNSEALKDGSPQVGRNSNQLPTIPASSRSIAQQDTASTRERMRP